MIILKNFSIATAGAALTAMSLTVATPAKAAFISFPPGDMVPSLVISPTFDPLAPGGEVGTAFINNDSGALLASVANGLPLDPNGHTTPVNHGFGVNFVHLGTPVNASSMQAEPVPEPLTILGSGLALGFGSLMKRQQSRKLKKISVAE